VQLRQPIQISLLTLSFALVAVPAHAQSLIDTVNVGSQPNAVAVNPATNKIFVTNGQSGTVTIIDGLTDNVSGPITVGANPIAVAVNPATNKAYVANSNSNSVTVIDGKTLGSNTVTVGGYPLFVAVNVPTNKIYVANQNDNTVTVIDGSTNNTTTVPVGLGPNSIAVDAITNKIYVANAGKNCQSNTVTVIDGATNATTTVPVGTCPSQVAVNSVTNKIYVTNNQTHSVTVIDGATLSTNTVQVGNFPAPIAVNSVTNLIYTANQADSSLTIIDGTTLTTTSLTLVAQPNAIAVNPVTNTIYVTATDNLNNNYLTVINGATNLYVNLAVGNSPSAVAMNAVTDRGYVVNLGSNTVSVIAGVSPAPLQFVPVTPCRLLDTRSSGPIQGGSTANFNLVQLAQSNGCASLATATAYALNVTLIPVNGGPVGFLTIFPTGEDRPIVSTMNSDGRVKANAAVVVGGYQSSVSIYVSNTTNVLLDVNGYFATGNGSSLVFYPMTPCRVADTRDPNRPVGLGAPHLNGRTERDFPILSSQCGIPSTAHAYSLNFTALPYPTLGHSLDYLEVWPTGQMPQNPVSTLNNRTGTRVANAAIVPAGTGGEVAVYPSDPTDLLIDINGYFAPPGTGGLSLYPMAPCRVLDTRQAGGAFSGTLPVEVESSPCGLPSAAQGYVMNATVIPSGALGYLTLWPDGQPQPVVSTLNAIDGAITSNMAIVPTTNGSVDAFASAMTQLILDIGSYFAP
jgi:YVTN family beta-propeller protein